MNALKRYKNRKRYLAKLNLLAKIRKAIQPVIDQKEKLYSFE